MEEKKTNELNDETLDAVNGGVKREKENICYCINCGKDVEMDSNGCCRICGQKL